jgi:hypothetical protein
MWYAIIGIVAFFIGLLSGLSITGFLLQGGRQDEEHAASVRIADARENRSLAKKTIKNFEEKYQVSFLEFERSLAQSCSELANDQRLFDYADWACAERTLADAQEEVKFQQILLRE